MIRWPTDNIWLSFVPETSRYKLEEVDKVFRFTIGQVMSNGWAQMKWLVGKRGTKKYPELIPRSNDRSTYEVELDDRGTPTGSSAAVNEESEATNGYVGSPAS